MSRSQLETNSCERAIFDETATWLTTANRVKESHENDPQPHGQFGAPRKIRQTDHLSPRKSFDLERFTAANYLMTITQHSGARLTIANGKCSVRGCCVPTKVPKTTVAPSAFGTIQRRLATEALIIETRGTCPNQFCMSHQQEGTSDAGGLK